MLPVGLSMYQCIHVQNKSYHNYTLYTSMDDEHPNAMHYIRRNILCTYLHSTFACNIYEQHSCINTYIYL